MRYTRTSLFAAALLIGSAANAQNPPTSYTNQTTPYSGTESWYCERVTGTVNGRCNFTDLIGSITSLPNITKGAATMTTKASPAGTVVGTPGVMMALGATITPANTGNVMISISGTWNNSVINDQCSLGIRYGTGTAPINGAAATGTALGLGSTASVGQSTAGFNSSFSAVGIATGLTLATAYWIDVALFATTGGTCTLANINIAAMEQ